MTIDSALAWLDNFAHQVTEQKAYLTELDSAIGDADHGINMARGMTAVMAKLETTTPPTLDELFKSVGMTLVTSVGGASGPLYGTFFLRIGTSIGAVSSCDGAGLAASLRAGLGGLVARGKAELQDKTMFDAMAPALDAFDAALASGRSLQECTAAARDAAAVGRDATVDLVARKGRASYLGERSKGHMDPGATSTAMLFDALADTIA
ncbi:MAG: dihydroxyacetone kinase subunit L [Demequina sp.]|uniref:dihydroxyacetone kinase subunit DhaL n=1 Tax=Demequina sp. TaxID=2050685 RepID=UPI0019A4315E|nr:dihydroxyacetone kinase subunit DhaL [Demequina sp.]MBC7297393.1 dihydroxyacetone kinase subunit L [Demequina sp.]